jgi:hypothetical protein
MDPLLHYCYRTLNVLRVNEVLCGLDNPVRSILAESIMSIETNTNISPMTRISTVVTPLIVSYISFTPFTDF